MRWRLLNMRDVSTHPDVLDPLRGVAEVVTLPAASETLLEKIPEFDAYLASMRIQVTRDVLDRAIRLRVIANAATGLDHIDVDYAEAKGIDIVCLKDDREFLDRITATAEMTWALMLATVRRLPWAFTAALAGDWARDRFRGHQLSGKTLGILGYGRLGSMVASYGLAFRMRVLACDHKEVAPQPGVEMVRFDRVLAESDVLSIHIHLTEKSRGLIDAKALAKMKRGAVLINTSRGAIVDEVALLAALQSGHLGGAGLDVIDGEWRNDLELHPLVSYAGKHENLVITPHIAGATFESQRAASEHIIQKLKAYMEARNE